MTFKSISSRPFCVHTGALPSQEEAQPTQEEAQLKRKRVSELDPNNLPREQIQPPKPKRVREEISCPAEELEPESEELSSKEAMVKALLAKMGNFIQVIQPTAQPVAEQTSEDQENQDRLPNLRPYKINNIKTTPAPVKASVMELPAKAEIPEDDEDRQIDSFGQAVVLNQFVSAALKECRIRKEKGVASKAELKNFQISASLLSIKAKRHMMFGLEFGT